MSKSLVKFIRIIIVGVLVSGHKKIGVAMTFPVWIQTSDNHYDASLVGIPDVRVVESTREQALKHLKATITRHILQGELLLMDIEPVSIASLAGKYRDDPTLDEIRRDAFHAWNIEQST